MSLKVIFANSVDPDQQSDLGPHCLLVCKNRFEKFARIFSRRHKQTTFSDAGFLGALRVEIVLLGRHLAINSDVAQITNIVEPQWLKLFWGVGNLFETWVVRATEG